MNQFCLSELNDGFNKQVSKRAQFLALMDKILPWDMLLNTIEEHYPKGARGRPPVPSGCMLRIHFLQQWYSLSDPAMEQSLLDIPLMRRFAGVDADRIPDETTICRFRHFLERHGLTKTLFEATRAYLSERGLVLKAGTIVDATIVSASPSTKNRARRRDPEMRHTMKGGQRYFGMKAHIGTDLNGVVHSAAVTDASVHDSKVMDDLLHGEEASVYGDKAYANDAKRDAAKGAGVDWRVCRKARRGRKLTCADHSFNRKSNRTRGRVEHVFGVVKNQWGYRKVRYKGLRKNAAQVFTLLMLANFYRVRHELAAG